jgi:hypothetical protein
LVLEQDWGKTRAKASNNHNNIVGEERLAHIRIIVVSLGGKLTYVFFYVTMELHQQRYVPVYRGCMSKAHSQDSCEVSVTLPLSPTEPWGMTIIGVEWDKTIE